MRILTRYILGEILSHALIGCALFTFILFMPHLPQILETVVRNSSTLSNVAQIFLFTLPYLLNVTIPMSVLVGVLLGLSRLAADSEIIAMRAGGLGIGYFVRVASIVAIGGCILGLVNSLYVSPKANQAILDMEQELAASQASYQIQPRVFIEDFKDFVLYVQDVRSGTGAANWRQVFMADVSDPSSPSITTAASATVANDSPQELLMRLRNGAKHENLPDQPYSISKFATTDLPLSLNPQSSVHLGRLDTVIYAIPTKELIQLIQKADKKGPDHKRFLIELNNRFSYPAACLVLMLVGVPLGVVSRRGGKSSGFVFTLLLVILYYILSYTGVAMARQDKLPVFVAVWMANILFAVTGTFLLWQIATGGRVLSALLSLTARAPRVNAAAAIQESGAQIGNRIGSWFERLQPRASRRSRGVFPRILDEYVIRQFLNTFFLVLCGFVMLMLVFTFFELVGDIIRNRISLTVVGDYLVNLTPSMIYTIAPLAVLIAVLVTFGVLNRNSEIIAMKATGISLYRLVIPIVSIAALLAICLFAFDELYLPQANRKQEALRSTIKGRPPQTFLNPERQWIFGQPHPGEPDRIFYYQFFDRDREEFANMSIFELDPSTFAVSRRIFAARVAWDEDAGAWRFQNGWERDFDGANQKNFREFINTSFGEIHEEPSYFSKEIVPSQEMNFGQLDRYIRDLRQSGFDTMRLRVALWHKLAYPLIAVVMAMLAIPFALSMGRRGSLAGIAVAIGVAIAYWVVNGLFESMGNVNYLPAPLAAWSSDILFGLAGGYLLLRTPT
ncbi:LPS export ABC transporter permease LptG [Terracidiphilus gabretensis]|uniref:LPS export ABC transporter permease LptG n=1 Tax=Terracidiphilus gabretensis TaxID=1577687 RepID=UPI00071B05F2|nr:LPS export ABC transporter permease LptG [Terracidiphilus gabretensis]